MHSWRRNFAGRTGGAPLSFTKKTKSLAAFVALAFRETVCTSRAIHRRSGPAPFAQARLSRASAAISSGALKAQYL